MTRAATMFLMILIVFAKGLDADERTDQLASLDKLIANGEYEKGLSDARRYRDILATNDRLTVWELDFQGEVLRTASGRRSFYYLLSVGNSQKDAPGRANALPSISANLTKSDWRRVVVCIDLADGNIRWSRRIDGNCYLAVGPDSDDLYIWQQKLLRLDSTTGEVTLRRDLPNGGRDIRGLLLGHVQAIPQPRGRRPANLIRDKFAIYDPEDDKTLEYEPSEFCLLAPDESGRLVEKERKWIFVDPSSQRMLWTWPKPDFRQPPIWHRKNIYAYLGNERTLGSIVAVDASTGQLLWSTRLGWGAYSIRHHQLSGGGYPDESWVPLIPAGNDLLTLDGSGRVLLLDADRGDVRLSAHLSRDHLCVPRLIGDTVVVCSFRWIRAFSLSGLLEPENCHEANLRLRETRCLVGPGQTKEALELLDQVVERAPNNHAAWSLRGEICLAQNLQNEASYSFSTALSLTGGTQNEKLLENWGLVKLVNLDGRPSWKVQPLDGKLYAGTQKGHLWSIRLDSLETQLDQRLDHEIASLLQSDALRAVLGDTRKSQQPIQIGRSRPRRKEGVPKEWSIIGGVNRYGQAASWQGRLFRPFKGGGVRILDGTKMQELPGQLSGLGEWKIHLSPDGVLGYGQGGVFELDKDLRPKRILYRPLIEGAVPERVNVRFIRSTSKSIGIVVETDMGASFQVLSREGNLLAEASLGRFVSGGADADQLIEVGDGYLFSDRQLHFLRDHSTRSWTFGPWLGRTSTNRRGDRWRYFGSPVMAEGRIFVTTLDGQLLVFDPLRIRDATR